MQQPAPMLRQMKQLGINAKFMGGDGICTDGLMSLAGNGIADDQIICAEAGGVDAAHKKPLEDFKAAYKKKFGINVEIYAPYVYDAIMAMVEAMQKAKSSDPAKYLPFLSKIEHPGVTGVIAFDSKGDIKNGMLTLYTYKGGKRVQLAITK